MKKLDGVRLGSIGWVNPAWSEAFYPPDMPEAWQLTYYNTQFNCVFLPRTVWRLASPVDWAQWNADTHDQFLFLLEAEAGASLPVEFEGKAVLLGLEEASILWFSRDTDLKDLAVALSVKEEVMPRFLISQDGDLGQMERVATLLEVLGLGL